MSLHHLQSQYCLITYEHAEAAAPASEAAESNKFVFHEHVIPDTARLLRLAGYTSSNQVELETMVHTKVRNHGESPY